MEKLDGASCFQGSTPVHLANGELVPVKEIVDQGLTPFVLSYDIKTGKSVPKKVLAGHNNGVKENWVRVRFEDGSVITCTSDHLFYVEDPTPPQLSYQVLPGGRQAQVICACGWKEEPMAISPFDPQEAMVAAGIHRCNKWKWEKAIDLVGYDAFRAVMKSIPSDPRPSTEIVSVEILHLTNQNAYDLTIEDTECYFVGEIPTLVHNCSLRYENGKFVTDARCPRHFVDK